MQLGEISTRPNWNFDRKSWRYKRNFSSNNFSLFNFCPWTELTVDEVIFLYFVEYMSAHAGMIANTNNTYLYNIAHAPLTSLW